MTDQNIYSMLKYYFQMALTFCLRYCFRAYFFIRVTSSFDLFYPHLPLSSPRRYLPQAVTTAIESYMHVFINEFRLLHLRHFFFSLSLPLVLGRDCVTEGVKWESPSWQAPSVGTFVHEHETRNVADTESSTPIFSFHMLTFATLHLAVYQLDNDERIYETK